MLTILNFMTLDNLKARSHLDTQYTLTIDSQIQITCNSVNVGYINCFQPTCCDSLLRPPRPRGTSDICGILAAFFKFIYRDGSDRLTVVIGVTASLS